MSQSNQQLYEFGEFRLDAQKRTLQRKGELVPLAPKTFDLLLVLVRHSGQALEKDKLMEMLWPDSIVEEANLPQNISALRKALGESPNERKYITTISGRGYKFAAEVKESLNEDTAVVIGRYSKATLIVQEQEEETETLSNNEKVQLPPSSLSGFNRKQLFRVLLAFGIFVLVAGTLSFWLFLKSKEPSPKTAIQSLAVLPFINVSQDPNADYLADGITESIINNLSQLSRLKVMSQNSAFRFKNNQTDTKNIASQLNVETLVTGDIKQIGDKFVINVRLIDASDDSQIWGNQYVKTSADIIAIQNEIAQVVAQNLRLKLSDSERQQLGKNYTANAEAYQLYLRGRFHVFKLTPPHINTGISYFQQAIAMDSTYALAYVGIADAYRSLALGAEMLPSETLPKSKAAANKAIEIDDTLSEGHTALGMTIFWGDWDWSAAENQFKRALELNPNSANAHLFYAHLLSNTGRHAEALAEVKLARELDPLFPFGNALEGQFLLHAGRTDEALDRLQKTFELAPNFWMPHLFASSAYIEKGMYAEAIAEARKARELSPILTVSDAHEGYALAKAGRRDEARAVLNKLLKLSTERYVPPPHIARIYSGLGENDKTFEWLEKGYQQHDPKMTFLKVQPKWNNLRAEPRFKDLLRRMNFPL